MYLNIDGGSNSGDCDKYSGVWQCSVDHHNGVIINIYIHMNSKTHSISKHLNITMKHEVK